MSTWLVLGVIVFMVLSTGFAGSTAAAEEALAASEHAVLENEQLRLEVSPVGARIVSLIDKARGGEQVKLFPYVGGIGEVRFNGVINHDDTVNRYELTLDSGAVDGPTVTAVTRAAATADNPVAATVTKRYTLLRDSSRIRCELTLHNDGEVEFALMPWVRHLLRRGLEALPEEAIMTPHGAFRFGDPVPGRPDLHPKYDHHHFPAAPWTTRLLMPLSPQSNTLASVLKPADMLKSFNWHRIKEDFCTQEFIAAPLFLPPGQTRSLVYEVVLAAPVPNLVYASGRLMIGATPHPTGLAPDTAQIELRFAAPARLQSLKVTATLLRVDAPDKPLRSESFTLPALAPGEVATHALPLALNEPLQHQLRLTFEQGGQEWFAGSDLEQREPVVIPLVSQPSRELVVYPSKGEARDRLLKIKPRQLQAPRVARAAGLDVFALSASQRVFPEDRFEASGEDHAQLQACRNEYESLQLVLTPRSGAPAEVTVSAGDLVGPGGQRVRCDSANRLLEVRTTIPSRYNARYPVGVYREGLLPTQTLTLAQQVNVPLVVTYHVPPDAAPGFYRGKVRLAQGDLSVDVPVQMQVWNVTLPQANPWMDTPASLKGLNTGGVAVRGADGKELTQPQLLEATVQMHLKYRLTPCDAGITNDLLALNFVKFEPAMQDYIDRGATKIFLGQIPQLLQRYADKLPQVEAYLKQKGWAGYFYVRPGFDEASPDLVEPMREVCAKWKAVSSIPVMETFYHEVPPLLHGMLDIYCRSVSDEPWISQRMAAGDRFWKVNAFPQHVEIEPWTIRRAYLNFWDYRFTGTYMWTIKQWNAVNKWYEDFWCDGGVGNLSATLIWPHETGLLSSLGLEALRDAIEDNALFWMLRQKLDQVQPMTNLTAAQRQAVEQGLDLCNQRIAPRLSSVDDLLHLRRQAGEALSALASIDTPEAQAR